MRNGVTLDKLLIYIPHSKPQQRPAQRPIRLSQKRDRSINYLVVEAILQCWENEK